jgi:tRNA (guanine-N7-)-methyltransferase
VGRKNKLFKFSELLNFNNVVENYDYKNPKLTIGLNREVALKGRWAGDFFNNNNGITLELACGRGEYSIALASDYPNRNFIGVDVKGARIWKGAKNAIDLGLDNVGFLRTRIEQIGLFFDANEIDEIWITFPDPFLLKERNRLTFHKFLNLYTSILKDGGLIHLKTDDLTLYEFSLESFNTWGKGQIIYSNNDIYSGPLETNDLIHKTYYEFTHLSEGKSIKYIKYEHSKNKESPPLVKVDL